ncbi:uncharacterized protein LAESUDRAFT_738232 [Laetiporus sulphureus 93-53]|uniref:Uncharacterized protein n=1 Tax=Laetiporus sulphureus 93-53 TaxID=1314785 RepID=A0A165CW06_9APHY|nr:uncharacterized protein LAESUDRAFT_738232 [Laetiporus sulphureus 93-53]KZT03544.1 hypothetical protein LAESUDRAFT_738232 [Laetiporus sulphureus 93-53]
MWWNIDYLIIYECSMISRAFLAKLSRHLSIAKTGEENGDRPFRGINFPPVAQKRSAALYYEVDITAGDTVEDCLGRRIFEAFEIIVLLKEQVRVTDMVWMQFLCHLRHGQVRTEDIKMLKDLIITSPSSPPTDFDSSEWGEAALVTPRHCVCTQWNDAAVKKHCEHTGVQLLISLTEDSTNSRPLTSRERFTMASKRSKHKGCNEKAGLPDEVQLAIGMKVMVNVNVQTELDIVDIVLHPDEPPIPNSPIVRLQKPPLFVLVKLTRM